MGWLLKVRKVPELTMKEAVTLSPSALGHLATHVGAVIAFFAGAVSFGHIVKASEPVVSSVLNFVFMGEVMKWPVYAVLTIMATFMLIPISLAIEGPSAMLKGFHAALAKGGAQFMWWMVASGFFYCMYNEVAFQALGKLDPVSHAVANTMKRVVIIITAIIVFRTPVTALGIAGSAIAVGGTLLYSLAKNKFK